MGTYASLKNCSAEDQSAAFDRGVDGKGGLGGTAIIIFIRGRRDRSGFLFTSSPRRYRNTQIGIPRDRTGSQPVGRAKNGWESSRMCRGVPGPRDRDPFSPLPPVPFRDRK